MRSLGKIFLTIFCTLVPLSAEFKATVSSTKITQGESVVLTLSSDTSSDFPILSEIAGFTIENSSREESTSIINGRRSGVYKVHYVFTPTHTMTIPAYEMIEPGKKVQTAPITITVEKAKAPNRNDALYFGLKVSKKEVYEGEPFFVTIEYRQEKNLDVIDRRLSPPTGDHFWIDQKPIESRRDTASHEVIELRYIFTAQKSGTLSINPANIKVGERSYKRDAWGMLRAVPEYKTLFTDTVPVTVKPLPSGVKNVGDFTMDVRVDRRESNEKEPVNLIITLQGEGNVQDITPFKLDIAGVLVYDEEPKRTHEVKNDRYVGSYEQRFALVSDHDYTIPSIGFSYYSLKEKRIKTIKSNPLNVAITPTAMAKPHDVVIEKATPTQAPTAPIEAPSRLWWIDALLILLGGVLGFFARNLPRPNRPAKASAPKTAKGDKALLGALLPFVEQDPEVAHIVEQLSENIYKNGTHTIDAKRLKAVKKRYL